MGQARDRWARACHQASITCLLVIMACLLDNKCKGCLLDNMA